MAINYSKISVIYKNKVYFSFIVYFHCSSAEALPIFVIFIPGLSADRVASS